MAYHFDLYGWYSPAPIPGRETEIAPGEIPAERVVGEPWPNFTGEGWVMMSYVEPAALTAPPARAEVIQQQIEALEYEYLMPRVTRESLIAMAEERALGLGLTLEQLRVKNKGYAGLKALDEQIAALREQL